MNDLKIDDLIFSGYLNDEGWIQVKTTRENMCFGFIEESEAIKIIKHLKKVFSLKG